MGIIRVVTAPDGPPQRPVFSAAERAALALALLVLLLQAVPAGDALEYRRAALASAPWRALTGHLVHINWTHAVINALALLIVARLFAPDLSLRAQFAALALGAIAIGAALAFFWPDVAWYRGLSGALHALFFAGAAKWLIDARPRTLRALWLPLALFGGGWIKVLAEQPLDGASTYADWLGAPVVTQAHLVGALAGSAFGALLAFAQSARQREQRH
jgi:rhomboid family GlyGly-CTERM serine protease